MGGFEEAMHLPICVVEPAQHWKKVKDLMQRMEQMEVANAVLEGNLQTKNAMGRTQLKRIDFFRALPKLPLPPLPPIRASCTTFFGRQKRRFNAYYRTK